MRRCAESWFPRACVGQAAAAAAAAEVQSGAAGSPRSTLDGNPGRTGDQAKNLGTVLHPPAPLLKYLLREKGG